MRACMSVARCCVVVGTSDKSDTGASECKWMDDELGEMISVKNLNE